MLPSVHIRVESVVHPTEEESRVIDALKSLFPTLVFRAENLGENILLVGEEDNIGGVDHIKGLILKERIVDSARKVFRSNTISQKTTVYFNKQVATVQRISFCAPEGESPLGPITLTVESDRLNEVIDWLAPRTQKRQRG